jgi:hypothetical protein
MKFTFNCTKQSYLLMKDPTPTHGTNNPKIHLIYRCLNDQLFDGDKTRVFLYKRYYTHTHTHTHTQAFTLTLKNLQG